MKEILCLMLMILSPLKSNASFAYSGAEEDDRRAETSTLRFTLPTHVPERQDVHKLLKTLDRLNIALINGRGQTHNNRNVPLKNSFKKSHPDSKR